MGKIDTRGGEFLITQNRRVGIGDRFEESEPHRYDADTKQEGPELGNVSGRDEPKATKRNKEKTDDDTSTVAELLGDPSCGKSDQEVAEVMRKLDPGRLGSRQVKQVLEVLVHGVDHGVAEGPEEKERGDEGEGAEVVLAVWGTEHGEKLGHNGWGIGFR